MKNAYSIYDAKTHLSGIIRKVKQGSEFVISERGHPVAKLIPFRGRESFRERIERLQSIGSILPGRIRKKIPQGRRRAGGLSRFLKDRE